MGLGNLGDAAIQESFLQNIRERMPQVRLISFSLNPEDTKRRHHIDAYPIRWSYPGWNAGGVNGVLKNDTERPTNKVRAALKKIPLLHSLGKPVYDLCRELAHLRRTYHLLKSLDLLVMAGGGQLCELWSYLPFNVFKFCVLARLAGTPVFIVGVGADLLKRPLNRFFARTAVQLCDQVSVRSAQSLELLRSCGVKREVQVCPDPVYALDIPQYIESERSRCLSTSEAEMLLLNLGCQVPLADSSVTAPAMRSGRRVGLNPMGFCDPRRWPRKDPAQYAKYLDKLEAFVLWLLENDYEVEMFSSDVTADILAITDLKTRLLSKLTPEQSAGLWFRPLLTLRELLQQMSTMDYVVTCKFHGIVFAHMLEKPVISLSYLPKMDDLVRDVGHGEFSLSVEHFEVDWLIRKFQLLVEQRQALRALFRHRAKTYSEALQTHFDGLFGERTGVDATTNRTARVACR